MGSEAKQFRHINLNSDDEEELVVHAGGPRRADASAVSPAGDVPGQQDAPAPGEHGAAKAVQAGQAAASEDAAGQDAATTRRQEHLRRRAEELAAAEAGLEDPKTFAGMHRVLLVALALAVIAFIVYLTVFPR